MARNSEKAVTALARWRQMQLKESGKLVVERRPTVVSQERNLKRAEKWRNQVIRDIAKRVTQIQNAGLGEFKIRDLNDEINKLLKEKSAWEFRILELDGPDYKRLGPKLLDKEGREAPGSRGYKYFGAAKELPGVKELFEQEVVSGTKKSRAEMLREIDAEYYGYLDDDDNLLVRQEQLCEQRARKAKIDEFKSLNKLEQDRMDIEAAKDAINVLAAGTGDYSDDDDDDDELFDNLQERKTRSKSKKLNVDIPTLKEVEQALLEKKKKELLSKYVSDELIESEAEVRLLSGKI